ncbi:MAG: hypothetical protein IPP07_01455 [Holophagales bacterium]|nr:hypothetical protein [Holophagales bacterium]MBK9963624.1 hypothetical protein [Holophagales bacterium]
MSKPALPAEAAGETLRGRTPLDDLRRRMLFLARLLPFEHLHLLVANLDELEAEASAAPLLEGLSDSVELVASDVESALLAVWARS